MRLIVYAAAVVALTACASTSAPSRDQAASSAADLASALERAQSARQANDLPRAAALLRDAARDHPTDKQPWLRLAQLQFDGRDYNQAIAAAQEALQRDAADQTALSIVAVSGLRLASQSLQQLRRAHAVLPGAVQPGTLQPGGSTRTEAEALTRTIREALGEPVLLPVAAAASGPAQAGVPAAPGPRGRRTAAATVRPADRAAEKAAERAPEKAADKPVERAAERAAESVPERTTEKPPGKPMERAVPAVRGGNPFTILQ